MTADICDAIVVGGGHSGLVAVAHLVLAGVRTVVLESRSSVGDDGCGVPDQRLLTD